jgi:hypothetical protein
MTSFTADWKPLVYDGAGRVLMWGDTTDSYMACIAMLANSFVF